MLIVLASTSKYRKALMKRLGVPFRSVAPRCDEESFKADATDPIQLSIELSLAKAKSVKDKFPEAILIGSDQVVAVASQLLGKPGSKQQAFHQLSSLCGRTHDVITGLAVLWRADVFTHASVAHMHMRKLTAAQIRRYLSRDNPIDCAGSYRIEGAGITLFEGIQTDDYTSISGLPLLELTRVLTTLGVELP